MDRDVITNALLFMDRVPLKGSEVTPFLGVIATLKRLQEGEDVILSKRELETAQAGGAPCADRD